MQTTVRAVAGTGGVGSGFLEESLSTAVGQGADFIGCDAGSTDAGPYYLGSGKTKASREAITRDTRVMMRHALDAGIPLLIGTAGFSGGRPHLDFMLGIVRELAVSNRWHFKLAAIHSEIDKDTLVEAFRAGQLSALRPAPRLDEDTIRGAERFVAMMGIEPFQRALQAGAQIVIAGRSSDVAIFAALPVLRGIPKGVAFHAGKILECGTGSVAQRLHPDSICAVLDEDGFTVEPPNPAMRCTPESVIAHTMYENADLYHLVEPGGVLDTSAVRYEAVSDRAVRVTGSRFTKAPYTVKVEGASFVGYRSVSFAGVDDPLVLGQFEKFLAGLKKAVDRKVRDSLGLESTKYSLNWRVYGWPGAHESAYEGQHMCDHSLGIFIDVVAPTQALAAAVVAIAWHTGLHHPIPEYNGLISNFAFPMSPPGIDAGAVYRFCANHVWKLDDPCAPFQMTLEEF
jgi:Acyclic terpene utilisation family protein AtuA